MLISSPEQITPEWLTERLTRQGLLSRGVVTQIRIAGQSSQQGTFGNTASLEVTYSEDTNGPVPRRLFLKVSKSNLHPETRAFGEREVAFYHVMTGPPGEPPIPRCYDSAEERRRCLAAVTLTHGDAHPWSFMLPRTPEAGHVMVIDWQLWEINVPTDDLAYFMAFWWAPGRRAALERPLLETYHRHLLDYGVQNYDWDACWRDYRESVAYTTLIPIGQFRRKVNLSVLWSGLENSTAAFQDLSCADLL